MSVPFQKNVAVEFAQKILDGKDIKEALDETGASVEDLQEALQELSTEVDGLVTFDYELDTEYPGKLTEAAYNKIKDVKATVFCKLTGYLEGYAVHTFAGMPTNQHIIKGVRNVNINCQSFRLYITNYETQILDTSDFLPKYDSTKSFSYGSWDTTPTADSTKPVTSGGIKTYVDTAIAGITPGTKLYFHNIIITLSYTYNNETFAKDINFVALTNFDTAIDSISSSYLYWIGQYYSSDPVPIGSNAIKVSCQSAPTSGSSPSYIRKQRSIFNANPGFVIKSGAYPGASNSIEYLGSDSIDLQTGLMVTGANLISNVNITSVSDTVTPF